MDVSRHFKDLKIETLRGLALILMVIGHIIGDSASVGMRVPDDSVLRYLYDSLIYIRMPLFTAISGYVYALRPVTPESRLSPFLRGKAYRIGIPLIVVSLLFFISQSLIPNTSESPELENFFSIFIYGYAHFWFLQAILVIFLIIAILEKTNITTQYQRTLWILIGALVIPPLLPQATGLFSVDRAIELFPFFLLGLCICRFPGELRRRRSLRLIPVVSVLLIVIHQAYLLDIISLPSNLVNAVGVALGLCAIYTLITYRFYLRPLRFFGQYAYEVYLFHVFGTAGARIVLNKLGVYTPAPVFTLGLAAGLLLPIGLKLVARQNALFDLLLFGSKRAPIHHPQKQPLREGS